MRDASLAATEVIDWGESIPSEWLPLFQTESDVDGSFRFECLSGDQPYRIFGVRRGRGVERLEVPERWVQPGEDVVLDAMR